MVIINNLNNVKIEELEAWATLNVSLVVNADRGTVEIEVEEVNPFF